MTTHVNDAGTWRQLAGVYVNDAGTWREIQEVYVNDAGTWRSVFVNDLITIIDDEARSETSGVGSTTSTYRLTSTGIIQISAGSPSATVDSGFWITPQTNMANFEVRATQLSGTMTTGTLNAWQNLGTSRAWTLTRASVGTSEASLLIEIRNAANSTVMDSATINFVADKL